MRVPRDLEGLDGLVIPGGESSVIDKLARTFGVADPLRAAVAAGLPVLATCAGLIYCARELDNPSPGQQTLGHSISPCGAMPLATSAFPPSAPCRSWSGKKLSLIHI